MANVVVCYPRHEGARFDADYYRDKHMPLVERLWGSYGMTGADVMFPVDDAQPFAAMVVMRFDDASAIDTMFASPGTPEVMADVANFTDIQATVYRTA